MSTELYLSFCHIFVYKCYILIRIFTCEECNNVIPDCRLFICIAWLISIPVCFDYTFAVIHKSNNYIVNRVIICIAARNISRDYFTDCVVLSKLSAFYSMCKAIFLEIFLCECPLREWNDCIFSCFSCRYRNLSNELIILVT